MRRVQDRIQGCRIYSVGYRMIRHRRNESGSKKAVAILRRRLLSWYVMQAIVVLRRQILPWYFPAWTESMRSQSYGDSY